MSATVNVDTPNDKSDQSDPKNTIVNSNSNADPTS